MDPIRGVYSQPGTFDEALFVVSDTEWYRVEKNGVKTLLASRASAHGLGQHGRHRQYRVTPEFMFMTDGRNLVRLHREWFCQGHD
jgi:hypothetical protein